jgi:hypothetical protein
LSRLQQHYRTIETRCNQAVEALKLAERRIRPAHEEMLESRRQRMASLARTLVKEFQRDPSTDPYVYHLHQPVA